MKSADRLMTTENMSLSTECAAALLSFRYPSVYGALLDISSASC